MSAGDTLTVAEIWRYPVKSMSGKRLDEVEVGIHGGIAGGRSLKSGAIRGARHITRLPMCSARYIPGTSAGFVPHVELTCPTDHW